MSESLRQEGPARAIVLLIGLVAVLLAVPPSPAHAQIKLENAAWVGGSVITLGVVDYIGYNLTYQNPTALTIYRVGFVLAQAAITWFLYEKCGLSSAIGFNLIWWTFGVDMVYYGTAEISPIRADGWAGPGAWTEDSHNGVVHARWTPIGLLRGNERVPANTVIAQSIIGGMIGIGISITL